MSTTQQEQLNLQMNVNDQHKQRSGNETTSQEILNSPFNITGNEDMGYFITLGRLRLTEPTKTIEETNKYFETHKDHIIVNMTVALVQIQIENLKTTNK